MYQVVYFAYSRKEDAYYVARLPEMRFSKTVEGAEFFTRSSKKNVAAFLERIDKENEYDWYIEKIEFNIPMEAVTLHGLEVQEAKL